MSVLEAMNHALSVLDTASTGAQKRLEAAPVDDTPLNSRLWYRFQDKTVGEQRSIVWAWLMRRAERDRHDMIATAICDGSAASLRRIENAYTALDDAELGQVVRELITNHVGRALCNALEDREFP